MLDVKFRLRRVIDDAHFGRRERGLAKSSLARIEELAGVPVDIISTGPDREQTIIKTHPFG